VSVVKSNDTKRARLGAMCHVLSLHHDPDKYPKIAAPPDPLIVGSAALLSGRTANAQQILPRLQR